MSNIGSFIQSINREIVSAIISRQPVPLNPAKAFTCFMADTRVSFDIGVDSGGDVTDAPVPAVRLRFEFRYIPEDQSV